MLHLVVITLGFIGLSVAPIDHQAGLTYGWQVQGGPRETIQVTVPNSISPQPATVSVQGDQEASDNLQPAAGYGALTWKLQ